MAEVDGVGALTLGGFLERGRRPVRPERGHRVRRPDAGRRDRAVDLRAPRCRGAAHRAGAARRRGGARGCGGRAHGQPARGRGRHLRCGAGRRRGGAHVDLLPRPELAHLVDTCRATVVLTQSRLLARRFGEDLAAIAQDRPHLRRVAVLGDPSWDELLAAGDAVPDDRLDARAAATTPDEPALVIFSSGTTSAPKGILHRHRSPSLQCWLQAARVRPASRHPHVQRPTAVLDRRVQHRRRGHAGRRRLLGGAGDLRPRRPRWR